MPTARPAARAGALDELGLQERGVWRAPAASWRFASRAMAAQVVEVVEEVAMEVERRRVRRNWVSIGLAREVNG